LPPFLHLPPPSCAKASRRWISTPLLPLQPHFSTVLLPPPPHPSHENASWRWTVFSCILTGRTHQCGPSGELDNTSPTSTHVQNAPTWCQTEGRTDHTTFLTSQRRTAMSIDIRIAVARFPGWCSMPTRTRVSVPPGFWKTPTLTRPNPYPCARVRVFAGTGTGSPGIPQGYP